jgi:conjugal transfer pilus assembly protein TraV
MKTKVLFAMLLPLLATGCGSMFNTAENDSFSCPGMPQGIICKTPLAVYKSTNQMPPPTDSDMPIGQKVSGVRYGDNQGNVVSPEPAASRGLPGLSAAALDGSPRPVRTSAEVMRIWIAPWVDSHDDLHYPSYLFTEVQARRWSFGKTEFAGAGVVIPHRDIESTASDPHDKGSTRSSDKPDAPRSSMRAGHQDNVAPASPETDAQGPQMPPPSDINLD